MHILVLIIQFPPDVNSSGLLMAQLAERLIARGHKVSVITSFPHYANFRITDEFRGKLFERSTYHDMGVLRLYVYASGNKRRMLNRLISYLSFNVLATIAGLLSRQHYDLIFCSNGSFFSGLAASVIGAIRATRFIYNVQDLYPDTPVQAGQLNSRLAIRLLEWLEKLMYSRSAHVSVVSSGIRHAILSKGVHPDKVSTIPNFVDTDFIRPLPRDNAYSKRLGLSDKFVVTHAGNVGYVYDLETLIEAACLLRDEARIQFLIVGDGVVRPDLEAKVRTLGLDNVRFLPFQHREELPWLRASSDVQVALYKPGSAHYSMPSKVYEIMASGRPVLGSADAGSDLWNLVTDTRCGMCVEPHDGAKLASAIRILYSDPELRERMGARGRLEVERAYSPNVVAAQYDRLIRSLESRTRPGTRTLLETGA